MTPEGLIVVFILGLAAIAKLIDIDTERRKKLNEEKDNLK